jgi:predicted XRE-type DNA-binding protein
MTELLDGCWATVTKGSGNVIRDLGFSEETSAELILKSSLFQALQETIKGRGWRQVEAATQAWTSQGIKTLGRSDGRILH